MGKVTVRATLSSVPPICSSSAFVVSSMVGASSSIAPRFTLPSRSGDMVSLEEYVKQDLPPRIFAPGKVPAYSNYATALAGYIVERVSGQSYDEYVENQIFRPLGMTYSTFRQPVQKQFEPHLSQGYGPGLNKPEKFEFVVPAPAGSQSASGAEMASSVRSRASGGPSSR